MRVIVCDNYEELSKKGAKLIAGQIMLNPKSVLGLATGSTPEGLYERLIEYYKDGEIDFSQVVTFNLDEYYPISPENEQSYRYFMNEKLFDKVNIKKENTHVPNGETDNPMEECENYEKMIDEAGGIDLQLLGIGQNGHIGFNEPDENLNSVTHVSWLTESTINANARFFNDKSDVPTKAITMGIGSILKAKKIILLASGESKREAVKALLDDSITTRNPATMLKVHSDITLICDKAAYGE